MLAVVRLLFTPHLAALIDGIGAAIDVGRFASFLDNDANRQQKPDHPAQSEQAEDNKTTNPKDRHANPPLQLGPDFQT
jgi:hypothetical protein